MRAGAARVLGLVAWTLVLAACQPASHVRPEPVVPAHWPQHPGIAQPPTGDAVSLAAQPWAQVFPVPELSALVEEALAGSSDLRIAVERIELARAQFGLQRSAQFPSIGIGAAAARERMPGAHPRNNRVGEYGSLSLAMPAWEIDLWGKLADRSEAARRQVLATDAAAQVVRISLVAQVSALYLDLLDIDNQLEISRRTLDTRRHALRLTRARFDEGISSIIDVRQAESLLAVSEQAIADQRRRLAQSENALSVLIGRNPGSVARSVRLEQLMLPSNVAAGLPSELLMRRPDILAAEESLRGASASVDAARKAFLPSLSLTTMLGFASPELGQLFDSGRFAWSIQPAVGLPLFTAGRLQAGVDQAEAQQRILVEQYKATVRQAFREVSDALVAFEQRKLQQEATQRIVLADRERLRVTNVRYLSGIASYFEVLDAERQSFDSELALSQAARATHQAVVQLYLALGGGWSRPAG